MSGSKAPSWSSLASKLSQQTTTQKSFPAPKKKSPEELRIEKMREKAHLEQKERDRKNYNTRCERTIMNERIKFPYDRKCALEVFQNSYMSSSSVTTGEKSVVEKTTATLAHPKWIFDEEFNCWIYILHMNHSPAPRIDEDFVTGLKQALKDVQQKGSNYCFTQVKLNEAYGNYSESFTFYSYSDCLDRTFFNESQKEKCHCVGAFALALLEQDYKKEYNTSYTDSVRKFFESAKTLINDCDFSDHNYTHQYYGALGDIHCTDEGRKKKDDFLEKMYAERELREKARLAKEQEKQKEGRRAYIAGLHIK